MKIIKTSRTITADDEPLSVSDALRRYIKQNLTDDICIETVNLAYGEDGKFESNVFMESDVFFSDVLANDDPHDIAVAFFKGKDLDEGESPANPTKPYFRLDKDKNVESTNDIGDIYYHELKNDVIDYIMERIAKGNGKIPELPEVQELLDEFAKS